MISKKSVFHIFFISLLLFIIPSTNIASALPDNTPFDNENQSICYLLDELDEITLDGSTDQSDEIRRLVNLSAQEILGNTHMTITDEPCYPEDVNSVRSFNFENEFTDGYVFEMPLDSEMEWKEITFNVFNHWLTGPHAYSTTTDCFPITEVPNLQYITNHEFGHFAGLDHVAENEDNDTDYMSRNCNTAYATIPQESFDTINEMYLIPEWIKNNAGWWAEDLITDNDFVGGIEFLIQEGIIPATVQATNPGADPIITEWVKTTAGWWADGLIDDQTFVNAIEYLMQEEIILIDTSNPLFEIPTIQNVVTNFLEDFTTKLSFIDSLIPPVFAASHIITPTHLSNIDCTDDCFTPYSLAVDEGEEFTFSNTANVAHTFTSGNTYDGPDGLWDSGLLQPGESYSYTNHNGTMRSGFMNVEK